MINTLIRKNILDLTPYSSARNEFRGKAEIYLDANENPISLGRSGDGLNRYPDPKQIRLKERISGLKNVGMEELFIGNGSDEAIDLLIRCFCQPGNDSILVFTPTYGMYSVCARINDVNIIEVPLNDKFEISFDAFTSAVQENTKLVFICSPNNPSGNLQPSSEVRKIIETFRGLVVMDEAYIDFCPEKSMLPEIKDYKNLVILQTLSKAWGLAGARIGLAIADPVIIKILSNVKYPYNIGSPSMKAALKATKKVNRFSKQVSEIISQREFLVKNLNQMSFISKVFPSDANFLLIRIKESRKAVQLLAELGIVVRYRGNLPSCEDCIRITIGTKAENKKLVKSLQRIYENNIQ